MRKVKHWLLAVGMVGLSPFLAGGAYRAEDITLLVVPARYSVMQVAFDIISRYPVVLVSYQGDATTPAPRIHAWNGREWVGVTATDYVEANFMTITPGRAVLVGDDALLPPVMASISSWCPKIERAVSLDTAALINFFGHYFDFERSEWQWFAARYNLNLTVTNAPALQGSWYDRPYYEDEYFSSRPRKEREKNVKPAEVLAPAPVSAPAAEASDAPSATPTFEQLAPAQEEEAPAPVMETAPASEIKLEPVTSSLPAASIQPAPVAETEPPPAQVIETAPTASQPAVPSGWVEQATDKGGP